MFWNKKVDRIYDRLEKKEPEVRLNEEMGKGDFFWMVASAWVVIIPVCLVVLGGIILVTKLLLFGF